MMMKKVLHIWVEGELAGAQKVVIRLIEELRERSEYGFYCTSLNGAVEPVLQEKRIPFTPYEKRSVRRIRQVIRQLQPDILHAHDFTATVLCVLAGGKLPILSHLHQNPGWNRRFGLRSLAYFLCCARVSRILTVSDCVMQEAFFRKLLLPKTVVVGNPFDAGAVRRLAEEAAEPGQADVLFLGRFHKAKNPLGFVEIVALLAQRLPAVQCLMIGDGVLKDAVLRAIAQKGLEKNIRVLDYRSNPYPILKNAGTVCMPSAYEGFGLVAAEALTLGVPVVASPAGGLAQLVDDSCGRLCRRPEDFARELEQLLTDKAYRETKARNARRKALQLQTTREYCDKLLEIYDKAGRKGY